MPDPSDHKRTVRDAFTEQADAYAANATVSDQERIARLVEATGVGPDDHVLDVATGPGHVAFGFGEQAERVIGVDLTTAPLEIASERRREREMEHVDFVRGDAEALPCPADTFDVIVCRLALHHAERPARVVREMARVCRPGGTVAVGDLVGSEHVDRAAYQNRFERLRDPSHVRALPVSELLEVLTEAGVEVDGLETYSVVQHVDPWLSNAETPGRRAKRARELLRRDAQEDLSGTRPYRRDGELHFCQRHAILAGRLLE